MYVFTIVDFETIQSELIDTQTGEVISMELKGTKDATEYRHALTMLGYSEICHIRKNELESSQ